MKWLFYVIVVVYMLYRTVYGLKPVENELVVERVTYGDDNYLKVGGHKTISCRGARRNQKVEWVDPNGRVVKRIPGNRIFSQEHFVAALRGRAPALVLTITSAKVEDSGVYTCVSGDVTKNVTLCVIDPSEFIDTPAEIVADLGRSITLTCQAKGQPEPRILWSRNNVTISDDDTSGKYRVMTKYNIEGFEGLLTITSLEPKDNGIYSCISIQETEDVDCELEQTFNITLNVNYAPIFEDSNDTQLVFGRNNQELEIICTAEGYPAPTYRWFKEISDDVLFEFDKKQIKFDEDENQAVLTVVANQSTFGQRYKCIATNENGESEKYYSLMRIEKPKKLSDVNVYNASANSVYFNVTWDEDVDFPFDAFDIQYIVEKNVASRKLSAPKELTWRKSKQTEVKLSNVKALSTDNGDALIMGLDGLEEDTAYWVRLRVKNEAGDSSWSDSLLVSTILADAVTTEPPEAEPETTDNEESMNDATFYGIFFAGGIFVVSFVCMFAMRMVK